MKTKATGLALVLIFFLSCTKFVNAGNDPDEKYSFVKKYEVSSPLSLKVSTTGGNIEVSGMEGNTAEVFFMVRSKGKLMNITFEQLKDYADVTITNEGGVLSIEVTKMLIKSTSIGFRIKAPLNTSTTLNTAGGNICLEDIKGNHNIKTSGGNIILEDLVGDVIGKTSGGNISVEDIDGTIDLHTSGGNINAENLNKGIVAHTSGGNINLAKIRNNVDVSTSGGHIKLEDVSGIVKASTSGGDINANISTLTQELTLKTSGGNISATIPAGLGLDLDLSGSSVNTKLNDFSGTSKKDKVVGTVKGGGIKVTLLTSGGNINLNYL